MCLWQARDGWERSDVGRRDAENQVTTGLVIQFVADATKGLHSVHPATDRQAAHTGTSMISSVTGPGIGSPCFSKLWR